MKRKSITNDLSLRLAEKQISDMTDTLAVQADEIDVLVRKLMSKLSKGVGDVN